MSEAKSDLALVRRVQAGEKAAFDLLVNKYQGRVAALISRWVREPADVADVAQEAFIKAYRGLARFRGDSAFYTWLYRIAVNTAKNHLASKASRSAEFTADTMGEDGYLFDQQADHDTPERMLATEQLRAAIHDSIAKLPEDLRLALTLREHEGMSYEDIAQVMSCPIGTVRSRIFRAREAIDSQVQQVISERWRGENG